MQNVSESIQAVTRQQVKPHCPYEAEHPKEFQNMQENDERWKMAADAAEEVCHSYILTESCEPIGIARHFAARVQSYFFL